MLLVFLKTYYFHVASIGDVCGNNNCPNTMKAGQHKQYIHKNIRLRLLVNKLKIDGDIGFLTSENT